MLLEHMAQLPHARANFKQLVREFGAHGDSRTELETALTRLVARGELIELRSGHYTVTARSREYAVGRLEMHRNGFGFLISERPIEGVQGDVFIPPDSAEKAMHGDRVVVRIARIEAGGRADGEIVKILEAGASGRGGRIPHWGGAGSTWCRTTSASTSGSRFRRVWSFPRPRRRWTALGRRRWRSSRWRISTGWW